MKINGLSYSFVQKSPIQINIVDSFVADDQKLGSASGEHKLYIRQGNLNFFGGPNFKATSYVKKSNLEKYLDDIKPEYFSPQRNYGQALSNPKQPSNLKDKFIERKALIKKLNKFTPFTFRHQIQAGGVRYYGKGGQAGKGKYDLGFRPLFLLPIPHLTTLEVSKYKSNAGREIFIFEIFYNQNQTIRSIHPYFDEKQQSIESQIPKNKILTYQEARIGQGKFRLEVLKKYKDGCVVTNIRDNFLLEACHIIPYSKASLKDKIDPNNGIALTPTVHKLFDSNKISFDKNYLVHSDNLSQEVISNLSLSNKKIHSIRSNSFPYLKHHFKDFCNSN